jgi:hypothetical protein
VAVFTILVVGAAFLLTWMVVQSYTRSAGSPTRRRAGRGRGGHRSDSGWVFAGGNGGVSDCSPGDAGGGCDGGGGGGGD